MSKIIVKNAVNVEELLKSDGARVGAVVVQALQQIPGDILLDFCGINSVSLSAACQIFSPIVLTLGPESAKRLAFTNISGSAMRALEIGYEEVVKSAAPLLAGSPMDSAGL